MHTATTILFFSSISTTQFYCLFSPTTTAGIPLSSLFLYHTATVTLLSLLLLHHHIYDFVVVLFSPPIRNGYVVLPSLKATRRLYCRVILLYHTAAAAFSSLIYDHHIFIFVLSPRPHFQRLRCLLLSIITSTISVVVLPFPPHSPDYVVYNSL